MRIQTTRCFAIVPAAGSGSRMRSEQPKQYLPLLGQPLIRHTLGVLCDSPVIDRVYVVLSVGDQEWDRHDWSSFGDRLVPLFCGGASRADSVLNGLRAIADDASEGDWVLVHDAARPCLAPWHIEGLVRDLMHDEVGGILAVPVADTLKREDSTHHIAATVPRDGLWQAQTPQMFRYVMLKRALETARQVTDEASAIEAMGLRPRLVRGDPTNLKVTFPLDLHLAEWILQHREA
ncbi:2-C-methyl-D-erythritol 4-phosphate cytidylyltransferase [Zoogloea sp.]|jgi:2-C-methyl-D-erythritol 4-phosphate cytidylyltransferase|uniref:2-C-methyl-D-erythritol 4-phosphate cytidylyltransferase n=1 Tax=Zoogloea sp. TaxID=49181 RepID=UPI0011D49419|nr:2-C-methyl-D-erythritol 4-phosphate cytidylyltransferase [Zoogloea sp.]MBK6653202.1 2-C-methyl-D-erythritol 4-phosphate cytidylyltransferase [Zoogloea sp.]MBK7847976.1 2-C-methyl-D-erythritol 4-phosphate cytidylyltransferase [Zoogloea sp.]MBP7445170.1 2-C-methyl-D-erythritol 4-phosphate cytidylyltransferase [Zoogloea sp.]TXG95907.1 MAG: 2-C-methyl-D-erythritol 4-phosphate cytidylyltransferase [Zoogloea sp.]HOY00515.1 2-C-methyl-D-erythritol 4-phosphate cytidylyltransferase [Zoogloea sp.]